MNDQNINIIERSKPEQMSSCINVLLKNTFLSKRVLIPEILHVLKRIKMNLPVKHEGKSEITSILKEKST